MNATAIRRGAQRDALLFYLGRFLRDGARWTMAILAMIFLSTVGFGNTDIGDLLGISLAGGFVLSVLVMISTGHVSTKTWSIWLAVMTGAAGVLLTVTDNFWLLAIGGFVGSYAASGVHWGAMLQLEQIGLTRVVPAENRTRAFSYLTMSSALGRVAGGLLAGLSTFLISNYAWEPIDAYKLVLYVYAGTNMCAACVYSLLSKAVEPVSTAPALSTPSIGLVNPFKARSRRKILTISGLFSLDSFAGGLLFESFLSFWLFTKFGISVAAIGMIFVVAQGANMVSLALAPWVAKRIGLLNTLVFSQVLSNLMLIFFAFSPNGAIAVAFVVLRALFDEMDVPTRQSYMMAITPPDEQSVMAGAANLGRGLGRIPSATVTGLLWSGALTVAPWLIAAGLKLTYDFAIYAAFRGVKPPEEET